MCVTPGPCLLRGQLLVAEEVGVGRKMILLLGWLTRGVRLAAAAGEVKGRAGVSGALGRLAGPGAAARAGDDTGPTSWATRVKGQARLGWASWAGRGRLG